MENYTDEQLRLELERRGYYTENLWTKNDVESAIEQFNKKNDTSYGLEDLYWEAILDKVLTSEDIMSRIHEAIEMEIEDAVNNFNNGN